MDKGKELVALSQNLPSKSLPTYDKGAWTGLKLILEKYYLKTYLDILGRNTRVGYVDLFAGPGLNLIGDEKVPIPGSPLIPIMLPESKQRFSSYIFSDTDKNYVKALRERVRLARHDVSGTVNIMSKDANLVVDDLPKLLEEERIGHCFVFIDPEGMEFKWESLQKLVRDVRCDLIINFPSSGIQRNLHNPSTTRSVAEFLGPGTNHIPASADERWAIEMYRANLRRIGKDISTEIEVRSGSTFHYHLIPAVRKTYGGSPWFFRVFVEAKKKIERLSGEVLDIVAAQIEGKMRTIGNYVVE